jgi:hypothetical protein
MCLPCASFRSWTKRENNSEYRTAARTLLGLNFHCQFRLEAITNPETQALQPEQVSRVVGQDIVG